MLQLGDVSGVRCEGKINLTFHLKCGIIILTLWTTAFTPHTLVWELSTTVKGGL